MPKLSAGLLLFRQAPMGLGRSPAPTEVLLGHPGGPFWARKDAGAWSIPKGEYQEGESPEAAARREFAEELGHPAPAGPFLPLGTVRQAGGKVVTAFAAEGDLDPDTIRSNEVAIAWPPRSGRTLLVPEIDRAEWFSLEEARVKILAGQQPFLDRLAEALGG